MADVGAATVFRQYDQAALDAEYDNQAKIGADAFRAFRARCAEGNERARQELAGHLDVAYGTGPAETLDIFTAGGAGPAPVEVFFHGGYWRMQDKRDFSYVAAGFVPHGRTTVIVDYALVPLVTLDALVDQCRRAVAWVVRHIGDYGGDPARIALSGHSAGGHLVAMLLATRWAGYGVADPAASIECATSLSGLFDLEPVRLCFLNATLGLTTEVARRNSPLGLSPEVAVPFLVAVGGREGREYPRQSAEFAQAWATKGVPASFEVFDADDHFTLREQLGRPGSPVVARLMRQRDAARRARPGGDGRGR